MCKSELSNEDDAVALFGAINPTKQVNNQNDEVKFTRPSSCTVGSSHGVAYDVAYMYVNSVIASSLNNRAIVV